MTLALDVKDTIQELIKAKKNIRIYPENNPVYARTINNVYSRMTTILDSSGSLSLKIKQHDIFFEGETVYHTGNLADKREVLVTAKSFKKAKSSEAKKYNESIQAGKPLFSAGAISATISTQQQEDVNKYIKDKLKLERVINRNCHYEERSDAVIFLIEFTSGDCFTVFAMTKLKDLVFL